MNQFFLQKGPSKELHLFPHIVEFAIRRNSNTHLHSNNKETAGSIRIFYILEGKFEWMINEEHFTLYPGDMVVLHPCRSFSPGQGGLNMGKLCWLYILGNEPGPAEHALFDTWSHLPKSELLFIDKVLRMTPQPVISKLKEAERIFADLQSELFNQQLGYYTRVNQLLDELFILIARGLTSQHNPNRDFPQIFMSLEQALRKNLSHQWTVEEMAAFVGLGTTTFTEKVKKYSGFTPLNYLITIRISEAIKLLKRNDLSLTAISLDTGFYSSQHFSTTFKKLTGYTPSDFRKKNMSNG